MSLELSLESLKLMRICYLFNITLLGIILVIGEAGGTIVTDDETCMICHKYSGLSRSGEEGVLINSYVDPNRYAHTVHTKVNYFGSPSDIKEISRQKALYAYPLKQNL